MNWAPSLIGFITPTFIASSIAALFLKQVQNSHPGACLGSTSSLRFYVVSARPASAGSGRKPSASSVVSHPMLTLGMTSPK
jgi:hypothetical protein